MTVKFKWKIPNTPLFNNKKAIKVFDDQIFKSLNAMTSVVSTNVKFEAPKGATCRLINSIGTSLNKSLYRGRVFVGVKYATIIKDGRKAAPVSKSANSSLRNWVRLSTKGQKYFTALKEKYPEITVSGAVIILKRSMESKAREPNPFFERGVKRSEKRLRLESGILLRKITEGLAT